MTYTLAVISATLMMYEDKDMSLQAPRRNLDQGNRIGFPSTRVPPTPFQNRTRMIFVQVAVRSRLPPQLAHRHAVQANHGRGLARVRARIESIGNGIQQEGQAMTKAKIPTPEEAAVKIQQGAAESIDVYRKLYKQYMELVAKGGHGSCCEMQSCLRWREELSLLELMELRLSPYYQRY